MPRKRIRVAPKKKTSGYNGIYLHTPSTLLNCAASDKANGGFPIGSYIRLIGESHAGKTLLALSILAEASIDPNFDDYDLIYDDAEHASLFDIERLFGSKLAMRMKAPMYEGDEPMHSLMVEDCHNALEIAMDKGKPFIYVLDSLDALDTLTDKKKRNKMLEARIKRIEAKGDYGMGKPKKIAEMLKDICGRINDTNSFFIVLSQTRDNVNPMSFEKKTTSGGTALKFFLAYEMWLYHTAPIPKTVRGEKYTIGHHVKIRVKKNKLTGKDRTIEFDTYNQIGIDNIASCINFLVKKEHWKKVKQTIHALGIKATQRKLETMIQNDTRMYKRMVREVGKVWADIEKELEIDRKPKYS